MLNSPSCPRVGRPVCRVSKYAVPRLYGDNALLGSRPIADAKSANAGGYLPRGDPGKKYLIRTCASYLCRRQTTGAARITKT